MTVTATLAPLGTRPFILLEVLVGAPLLIDATRRCIPLLGGQFQGEITGEVVPGGADWQIIHSDGLLDISAHYVLKTQDGALIEVNSQGLRGGSREVLERLQQGSSVDPSEYYFRTSLRFRTAAPAYLRLNGMLAISVGERLRDRVRLAVHEIL